MKEIISQVNQIRDLWVSQGIHLSESPTESSIRAFWNRLGSSEVPMWLLSLLVETGGMDTSQCTDAGFRFWNFDSIVDCAKSLKSGDRYLYFADQDVGVWFLALPLTGDDEIYIIDFEGCFFKLFDNPEILLQDMIEDSVNDRIIRGY